MSRAKNLSKTRAQAGTKPNPKGHPGTGSFLTGKKLNAVLCVLLAAVTIVLYTPVLGYGFVILDDQEYVTGNPHVQEGLNWSTIQWAFTSTETAAYWHPVTWLSHALDCQLFGLNPAGHHFDSVLIHALNAALLFLLLVWMTGRVGASLLVAALFAVHPLNVESVAWVAERKNVLSTLFFFLAIGAYVRYVRKPDWQRYLAVVGLFIAGLMAKPMITTLPCVLLLLDYWPLNRTTLGGGEVGQVSASGIPRVSWTRLVLEKVPLLLLSAASSQITLIAQRRVELTLEELPFSARAENALVSYGLYLWKMLWPDRLAAFYPHPVTIPAWQLLSAALVLLVGTVLVIIFRRKPYLPVGWFWFLGTLVPVIGLVQVWKQGLADRFAYIPLIGIFVMIAWSLDDWAEAREIRTVWRAIPALCLLTILSCISWQQIRTWKSEYALWNHAVRVTEQDPFAYQSLAHALMNPNVAMTANDLQGFRTNQERIDAARQNYEAALEGYRQMAQQTNMRLGLPGMVVTLTDLGNVAQLENRLEDARQNYEGALKAYRRLAPRPDMQSPKMAALLNDLGALDQVQNRLEDARQHYEEALRSYSQLSHPEEHLPGLAATLSNLGNLDRLQKRTDDARRHYEEALRIREQLVEQNPSGYLPDLAATLNRLGSVDQVEQRLDEARQHFEEAVKIYRPLAQQSPERYLPDLAGTLSNLGLTARLQKQLADSRVYYTEAMNIYRNLAQHDPARYASNAARVEARLQELGKKVPSR
ncbi:MAG: tetratricopeptide repeat protein [Terriglobales bacterium]|jgi:tetratricopeptide (TPR) repeat protein